MRRLDKEIRDRQEIDEVIRKSLVCRIAFVVDALPYLIPMSFGYDGQAIYLHTAREGKKIGSFEQCGTVCFEFESGVNLKRDAQNPCRWSFAFESVVGYGTVREVVDPEGKQSGLNQIMRQYSGREWPFNVEEIARTRVWRIYVDTVTGKRSP